MKIDEQEGDLSKIGGGILVASGVGIQVVVPMTKMELSSPWNWVALAVCAAAVLAGLYLIFSKRAPEEQKSQPEKADPVLDMGGVDNQSKLGDITIGPTNAPALRVTGTRNVVEFGHMVYQGTGGGIIIGETPPNDPPEDPKAVG